MKTSVIHGVVWRVFTRNVRSSDWLMELSSFISQLVLEYVSVCVDIECQNM